MTDRQPDTPPPTDAVTRQAGGDSSALDLTVLQVLARWRPGSGDWSWGQEIVDLFFRDPEQMNTMLASIKLHGLRPASPDEEPIILGDDGRVWSGHHRLVCAYLFDPSTPLPSGTVIGQMPRPDMTGDPDEQ